VTPPGRSLRDLQALYSFRWLEREQRDIIDFLREENRMAADQ
jgi:hypothetical protein